MILIFFCVRLVFFPYTRCGRRTSYEYTGGLRGQNQYFFRFGVHHNDGA